MKILRVILVFCLMSSGHFSYAQQCEHIVQRGENFESIASKYGVTIEERTIKGFVKAFTVALIKRKSEAIGDAIESGFNRIEDKKEDIKEDE